MSYATMLLFPASGPARDYAEYHNSHRGHPLVWSAFAEAFAKDRKACDPMSYRDDEGIKRFWKLTHDPTIYRPYRLVLQMTYDQALMRRADLRTMADALDKFVRDLPLKYGAGHLLTWAQDFRALATRDDFEAVGFNGTSVSDDTWRVIDETKDEGDDDYIRNYDLSRDTGHFFVGDEVPPDQPHEGTDMWSRLLENPLPEVEYVETARKR